MKNTTKKDIEKIQKRGNIDNTERGRDFSVDEIGICKGICI